MPLTPQPPRKAVYAILLVVGILGVAYTLRAFIGDFLLATIFAGLLTPTAIAIEGRVGRRWLASLIACVLVVMLIALPLGFVSLSLANEGTSLYQTSRGNLNSASLEELLFGDGTLARAAKGIAQKVGFEYTPEALKTGITKVAGAVVGFVVSRVNELISNLMAAAFHFGIFLLIMYFVLVDRERLGAFVRQLSPLTEADHEQVFSTFVNVGRAILVGNVFASVLQGVAGGLAWAVAGLPSAMLWGTVMSLVAFMPMVGTSLITVPAALYLGFVESRWGTAGIFFVLTAIASVFFDNVLKTRLMGSHIKMHDALIFLSIIGGLGTFGLLGLLWGPLVVALFQTVAELYVARMKGDLLRQAEDT